MTPHAHRVAVLGGGIAGLATAHFLLQAGCMPVLFEASDRLGGLGACFEHRGAQLDCFYHVILDSDADMCALIRDLGLGSQLEWRETQMGFHIGGTLYSFNTPADLLRFKALPFVDRLRTGLGALYITKAKRNGLDLDEIRAADWLRGLFGARVFADIWQPLLRAKFGDRADAVPAYWVWTLLNREKNGKQEVKGYLRGGYAALTRALRQAIELRGGEIRLCSAVAALEPQRAALSVESAGMSERFDAVVSTLPLPVLGRLARGTLATGVPLPSLAYQGVVNAVVLSRTRLERFYWTVVVDPACAFQGVVETTHVIPPSWVGNRHLIYLMNYCAADSELYRRPDALVKQQALEGLQALYPQFRAGEVEDIYVFRAPYVEPVWSLGYLKRRPAVRVGDTRLYISTTAQAYPRVTAWNTSISLARETVTAVVQDLRAEPSPHGAYDHVEEQRQSIENGRWAYGHSSATDHPRI